nr:hypothetical protein [uncultured Ottowia sp.]
MRFLPRMGRAGFADMPGRPSGGSQKNSTPPGLTGLNGGAPGRCVSIVQLKGGNESKKTRLPRPYGRSSYGMQALQFPIRPFAQYLFKHQKRC